MPAPKDLKVKQNWIRKISVALKGRHVSPETEFKKGYIRSEKTRKKWSNIRIGHSVSEKTKGKISKANTGHIAWNRNKKGVYSKDTLKAMSEAKKNRVVSEITKRKISKSLKGQLGKNSRHWKNGRTKLQVRIRTSFKYRQWRSDVFTRDDFTCQECGRRGGCLHAHHKEAFADIMEFNDIKTYEQAMDCEELWNINNGKTLCNKCHYLTRKNNIYKEVFDEWSRGFEETGVGHPLR